MKKLGLLIALVGLFSCAKNQQEVLTKYIEKANAVCNGDTTDVRVLHDKLSLSAQKQVDNVPGYLVYLLTKTTKKGTIEKAEIVETKQITKDSVVCAVKLNYLDKSSVLIHQIMVKEHGEWKLGISPK